ncbi:hypothetical protein [Paludisphaera sp.]|uniref:hypothetical protein n=1 Tax=Paludisphaera sp. TaxID=2017432 RepID=UPI00301B969C
MLKPPPITSRTFAGALVALLAFAAASSDARAVCHLPPGATPPGEARLDHLADLGALADFDSPAPPPPSPCEGPGCSGDPAPTPAPGVTTVEGAERWGCLAAGLLDLPSASPHPVPPPASLRPSHGGPAPFHPPRLTGPELASFVIRIRERF